MVYLNALNVTLDALNVTLDALNVTLDALNVTLDADLEGYMHAQCTFLTFLRRLYK